MKLSEFRAALREEFGSSYGDTLTHDLVLTELDGMTGDEALAAGCNPREVWLALCRATDVPPSRWYGPRQVRKS